MTPSQRAETIRRTNKETGIPANDGEGMLSHALEVPHCGAMWCTTARRIAFEIIARDTQVLAAPTPMEGDLAGQIARLPPLVQAVLVAARKQAEELQPGNPPARDYVLACKATCEAIRACDGGK